MGRFGFQYRQERVERGIVSAESGHLVDFVDHDDRADRGSGKQRVEACCGARDLARALAAKGHEVRLMWPDDILSCMTAQKNDDRNAEAIAEAEARRTMRFVELKSEGKLDLQTLHRMRDQLVGNPTSLMEQIRTLLLN